MAKKQNKFKRLSPEQYMQQKVRTLPIGDCYASVNWKGADIVFALVTRCHTKGTFTMGCFLIDKLCRGVMKCSYYFSLDRLSYEEKIHKIQQNEQLVKVSYEEVHNLIYGAIAFAEEGGIEPDSAFRYVKYILEEDTEDIPLFNYEFGKDGKHLLVAADNLELTTYYSRLNEALNGDFLYLLPGMKEPRKGSEYIPPHLMGMLHKMGNYLGNMFHIEEEPYSYIHPDYPTELSVRHEWIVPILYDPKYANRLPDELIQKILALPHDELRVDLEQITLFETGCTCEGIIQERCNSAYTSVMIHCMILLGELGNPSSLSVVLETLRQNEAFYNYHVGDFMDDIYIPTVYLLGKDRLEVLMDYMQTPGLYTYARLCVVGAVAQIVWHQPERRAEVIEWFRNLLVFYQGKLENRYCCDGTLVGLLTITLMDLNASELLPELKVLYDTGLVDENCAGDYRTVSREIATCKQIGIIYNLDIYKRYTKLGE